MPEEEDGGELFLSADEETPSCRGSPNCVSSRERFDAEDWESYPHKEVWMALPGSIEDRRKRFRKWMGLPIPSSNDLVEREEEEEEKQEKDQFGVSDEDSSSTGQTEAFPDGNYSYTIKNLNDGSVFVADEVGQDGTVTRLRRLGSEHTVTLDELQRSLESSFVRQMMRRDDGTSPPPPLPSSSSSSSSSDVLRDDGTSSSSSFGSDASGREVGRRRQMSWLKMLRAGGCVVDRGGKEDEDRSYKHGQSTRAVRRRVGVHAHKKQTREFSAVYLTQEIRAHRGAIWALKFSPCGMYLASGGEDGVVRVWKILERRWSNEEDESIERDPRCVYLKANGKLELSPARTVVGEKQKVRGVRNCSDPTFVVLPYEDFRISEKPLREFHGHVGDVLSLSWSKNQHILSSSTDKTVRLWDVGCERCIKVFRHGNYVTSVQFNPIADNLFISGSIDGKVRVWDATICAVVDWVDVKDMITAVCYRPDGEGVVIGTMAGTCRFYKVLVDNMQFDKEVSFHSKKSCKMITGFQFCPSDPKKLMVSCADSHIWILNGHEVISKYKGFHNAGSQISASFTADGRHIVSASEDSNVYIWDQSNHGSSGKKMKSNSSYEHFFSKNVSVAIPWDRIQSGNHVSTSNVTSSAREVFWDQDKAKDGHLHSHSEVLGSSTFHPSAAIKFSLRKQIVVEAIRRASATWPEEKLPSSSPRTPPMLLKSEYMFLKRYCEDRIASHAWGQVIVTAGGDGWIKAFHNYGLPFVA